MIGKRCTWDRKYPMLPSYRDVRFRIYEILSVTVTHVYIINVRTRFAKNVPIKDFNSNYTIHPSQE